MLGRLLRGFLSIFRARAAQTRPTGLLRLRQRGDGRCLSRRTGDLLIFQQESAKFRCCYIKSDLFWAGLPQQQGHQAHSLHAELACSFGVLEHHRLTEPGSTWRMHFSRHLRLHLSTANAVWIMRHLLTACHTLLKCRCWPSITWPSLLALAYALAVWSGMTMGRPDPGADVML